MLVAFGAIATVSVRPAISALPLPELAASVTARTPFRVAPPVRSVVLTVRRGDTLNKLFAAHGLSLDDLASVLVIGGPAGHLKDLRPGEELVIGATDAGQVRTITADLDESHRLEIARSNAGFVQYSSVRAIERRTVLVQGTIDGSLFASAAHEGLSGALTMSLAGIFGYDIDFLQDLRTGDRFAVLYEQLWRDGAKLRDGAILAAEFENSGRVLKVARFELPDGRSEYYSPDGASIRKALTRNPVDFTHISSGFSKARFHPILQRIRAHEGVDYAAPSGTPVRAAGDGKVVFRGVRGGYGNAIVIQHGATYSTLYGHLSRFARGLSIGERVVQDQVIGFVGMTGLATAPHLHYEILVNGVHRNPRTVNLPDAAALPAEYRAEFAAESAARFAMLETKPQTPRRPASHTST